MRDEDVWFTITKAPGQRRMTPRNGKGVLLFVGLMLASLLPLVPAVLVTAFRPSWWWVLLLYALWDVVLITAFIRIVRAHCEVIDMEEAVAALREKQRREGGGSRA